MALSWATGVSGSVHSQHVHGLEKPVQFIPLSKSWIGLAAGTTLLEFSAVAVLAKLGSSIAASTASFRTFLDSVSGYGFLIFLSFSSGLRAMCSPLGYDSPRDGRLHESGSFDSHTGPSGADFGYVFLPHDLIRFGPMSGSRHEGYRDMTVFLEVVEEAEVADTSEYYSCVVGLMFQFAS